jgi:hypothetical protein
VVGPDSGQSRDVLTRLAAIFIGVAGGTRCARRSEAQGNELYEQATQTGIERLQECTTGVHAHELGNSRLATPAQTPTAKRGGAIHLENFKKLCGKISPIFIDCQLLLTKATVRVFCPSE